MPYVTPSFLYLFLLLDVFEQGAIPSSAALSAHDRSCISCRLVMQPARCSTFFFFFLGEIREKAERNQQKSEGSSRKWEFLVLARAPHPPLWVSQKYVQEKRGAPQPLPLRGSVGVAGIKSASFPSVKKTTHSNAHLTATQFMIDTGTIKMHVSWRHANLFFTRAQSALFL